MEREQFKLKAKQQQGNLDQKDNKLREANEKLDQANASNNQL
jgi:hypothetical protein